MYFFPTDEILKLQFNIRGKREYEIFCFGIDAEGNFDPKCSVSENQKRCLNGALIFYSDSIEIILEHIPKEIQRLIFVMHAKNLNRFDAEEDYSIKVRPIASKDFEFQIYSFQIATEPSRASVIADISRSFSNLKPVWMMTSFPDEFHGLKQIQRLSLKKDSPRAVLLLDLSDATVTLEIQRLAWKIAPILLKFDAIGEIDYWIYASRFVRFEPINFSNFFIDIPPADIENFDLGMSNDPYVAMEQIFYEYQSSSNPILVAIVTNGDFIDSRGVKDLLFESKNSKIFWNFLGIGGRNWLMKFFGVGNYKYLRKFSEMSNVNFSELDDFSVMKDWEIRNCIRKKFLDWIARK